MRVLSVLASCLLAFVSADSSQPNPLSLFGKGVKAVASPVGKVAETVGSNTLDAAQSVGQGVGKGLQTAGNVSEDAARTVGRGVQKEVQAVKDPIDKTIAYIGSSQCQNVQKIAGVSYDQIQGEREPDVSGLEIVYKTQNFRTIINITDAPASLRQARKFDNDSRLVLFLHGFTDDPAQQSFATISQAFLDEGNHMSILALDASSLIRWFYIRAATYVRFIGTALGKVLAHMHKQGQDPKKIHIIGHSLGAHIGAFTAKTFETQTGHKIGRISGLDPAGPCFSFLEPDLRLQKTDAAYVDVTHTDAGVYGIKDAVGHKDYYPNGGSLQPNCLLQTCSHSRVWRLYAESVQSPRAFPAVRCASWDAFKKGKCEWDKISYMGHPSTPGAEGDYYLVTGEDSPYGRGLNGTKYHNNEGLVRNVYNIVG